MNITSKPVLLGVPMLMVAAMVAVMALWVTGIIGGGGGVFGGPSSTGTLVWNVEYWHRDSDGNLLQYGKDHNAITVEGLDAAVDHLLSQTVQDALGADDAFDKIILLTANASVDPASDGFTAANIALDIDGTNVAGGADLNPADGVLSGTGGLDGVGIITVTFVSDVDSNAIAQMGLINQAAIDTASTTEADIIAADILASLDITVTLNTNDTLQITWTIDFNAV
ncbi:MAG: hypothetical protein IIA92_07765 [Chloroflexi bacterium]|nr:hypothetical protein [Chloroflexota bacterium]